MKIIRKQCYWKNWFIVFPKITIGWKGKDHDPGISIEFGWLKWSIGWLFFDFFILNSFFQGIKAKLKGSELPEPE